MKPNRLTRKEKLLFATPLLLLVLPILGHLKLGDEELRESINRVAGPNAVDLGQLDLYKDRKQLFALVRSKKAFWASIESSGTRGIYRHAMVMSTQCDIYSIWWQHGWWFFKGHVVSIRRYRNLKFFSNGTLAIGGGRLLTPAEQAKLLQR